MLLTDNHIVLKHIFDFFVDRRDETQVVFDQKTAEEGLEALQNFIKECHLPTTLPELKSKVEITNDLLKKVADTTNLIKTNPRTLTKEEVYDILLECM